MPNNAILRQYLERVKTRIIDQQSGYGIRLTGLSANSIIVERARSVKTGRFVGGASLASIDYLLTNFKGIGVRPGVFPPFGTGSALYQWVKKRGISTRDGRGRIQTTEQTTFVIARAIFRRGTRIHQGTARGIEFQNIVSDELPETMDEITGEVTAGIIKDFNKAILL